MSTELIVAIAGVAVTLLGLIISGVFGLLANTSQREQAAARGVERAYEERLEFKDDVIAHVTAERDEARKSEKEAVLEAIELRGKYHALEVENDRLRRETKP